MLLLVSKYEPVNDIRIPAYVDKILFLVTSDGEHRSATLIFSRNKLQDLTKPLQQVSDKTCTNVCHCDKIWIVILQTGLKHVNMVTYGKTNNDLTPNGR